MDKRLFLVLAAICMVFIANGTTVVLADNVPLLKLAYTRSPHHMSFVVAMAKGENLRNGGTTLKTIVPKERYDLLSDGKKIASIEVIVSKSGAETATLFAMKRTDLALAGVTAMTSAIDAGASIKVLCPLHATGGMGLVISKGSPINDWNSFVAFARSTRKPISIGYMSPTNAPKILIEAALLREGLKISENPMDASAHILLLDLRANSNFVPALTSKQVDGYVAVSPFPETAEQAGVGKIILDLRDLPPKGDWHHFPCCVFSARTEIISSYPQVIRKFVELIEFASEWCNQNKDEVALISSAWLGLPPEAFIKSGIVFTTQPSTNWLKGIGLYLDKQNRLNDFSGPLKGKSLKDVQDFIFDFSFVSKR